MSTPLEEHHGEAETFVRSLERGIAVLRAFDGQPPELTLSEVAARTGMSAASARRYLMTLHALGYLGLDNRRFRPLPRLLELAFPYFASSNLTRAMESELAGLADRLDESCALTVLDQLDATNVFCVNAPEGLSIQLRVGRRLPTYCTAMGRALLSGHGEDELRAHLAASTLVEHTPHTVTDVDELLGLIRSVAERGHAIGDQEYEAGVRTIAMPVHDSAGRVFAAASVSTPTVRVDLQRLTCEIRDDLAATV
ncbi:MAG: IclR family transcriptional regulator domain-containing protein, partial [Pseudonocardia sp.]